MKGLKMRKITVGLFFILFNFNINYADCSFNIIPTFIGYIYFIAAFQALPFEQSKCYRKSLRLSKIMVVYESVLYFIGFFAGLGIFKVLSGVISAMVVILITYYITTETFEYELMCKYTFVNRNLKKSWGYLASFNALSFVVLGVPIVNVFGLIAVTVANICYISTFSQIKSSYYAQTPGGATHAWQ